MKMFMTQASVRGSPVSAAGPAKRKWVRIYRSEDRCVFFISTEKQNRRVWPKDHEMKFGIQ